MKTNTKTKNYTALIIIIAVALIAIAGLAVKNHLSNSATATSVTSSNQSTNQRTISSDTISYNTPGHGPTQNGSDETIQVNVSLDENNAIISISAEHSYLDGHSIRYQQNFDKSYESLVLGKNINDISLSRVAGASLTTDAFMQAIEQIKQDLS